MTRFRHALLLAACCATPALAQASFEDLAALDARIATALGAGVGEAGGAVAPIDRRLRLASCPQPATISAPAAGAVTVRCTPLGWRIRVAVGAGPRAASSAVEVPQLLVRRGEAVDLVVRACGFTVSGSGIAEQSGMAGDRIRIRLVDRPVDRSGSRSGNGSRIATGQILADGRVAIGGFN